jgi:hypothetical protein
MIYLVTLLLWWGHLCKYTEEEEKKRKGEKRTMKAPKRKEIR